MKKPFKNIQVNSQFIINETTYKKVSSRTGEIVLPKLFAGKRFYFGQYELVKGE